MGNGFWGMELSWFGIHWDRHLKHHRIEGKMWWSWLPAQSSDSSVRNRDEEYRDYGDRYRRQLHCQPRMCSLNSQSCCGYSKQHCRAQQRRWRHEEQDRRRIQACTSCCNRRKDVREEEIRSLSQFLLQRSGRWGSLEDWNSYPKAHELVIDVRRRQPLPFSYQNATDLVQSTLQNLLSHRVMTTSIIVGRVLLAADQQFRVEELTVFTSADLVDWGRVEIDEDGSRNIFAVASLCEDGIKFPRFVDSFCIGIRPTICFQAMLEEVSVYPRQFPLPHSIWKRTHNSQAEFPSCVPAWPICKCRICNIAILASLFVQWPRPYALNTV